MNKRAMFFTILVIAMLSLFLISYTVYFTVQNRESINKRIKTMNNFVFSIEEDLSRQLYISGFRIIFLFESRIIDTAEPIDNVGVRFEEIFFGDPPTLYGDDVKYDIKQLMSQATFLGIQESLNEKASKINVNIELTNPVLTVTQEDPWNVKVKLVADLLIEDKNGLVKWDRKSKEMVAYIPIEHFEDPLYIIETNSVMTNKINKTIYEPFVDGGDVSNLTKHVENMLYIESISGPSFLDRLEGDMTADDNGIESLVYVPSSPVKNDKSVVDYVYFEDNTNGCQIIGMPSWFRIHNAVDYGAEGLETSC